MISASGMEKKPCEMPYCCRTLKCPKANLLLCLLRLGKNDKKHLTRQKLGATIDENKGYDEDGFKTLFTESRWLV